MTRKDAAVSHGGIKFALCKCCSIWLGRSVSGRSHGGANVDCSRKALNTSSFLRTQSAVSRYFSLPWELRHHVHTFCVQGSYDNEVVVRRGTGKEPNHIVRQSTGTHSYQWVKDPIFQQSVLERIGPVAGRELLETYYKTRTFTFVHDELRTLRPFLEAHSFGLEMRPADYVRRVHLQLQPFKYAQLREPDAMMEEEKTCHKALDSLFDLQSPRTAIEIHADLTQGHCDDLEYNELLEDAAGFIVRIMSLVDRLKEKGLNIEISLEGRWNGKDGRGVCRGSVHTLDDCLTSLKLACQ